jgi:transcriptional regulator with XRE-family HTH domain
VTHLTQTVRTTVADNVRTYRLTRRLDQAQLARRMQSLGIEWRQATVSEVERRGRNVTIGEALGLALALDVTIEQLIDARGPEGEASPRGPSLVLTGKTDDPDLPPSSVTALVCRHKARAEAMWTDNDFEGIAVETTDDPPLPLYMGGKGGAAR